MSEILTIKNELVQIGKVLEVKGFIAGTDGNISARYNDSIIITPSGYRKGNLKPEDLVIIDFDGNIMDSYNKPSSEYLMHSFVYKNRPEIKACVHSHPPFTTAFAVSGEKFPENILPEVVLFVGKIPVTEYAPPGTTAVPDSLKPFIENSDVFVLRNHGLLTIGRNLSEALNKHETVEHYAKILTYSKIHGNINTIPDSDVERLKSIRQKNKQNES